MAKAKKRAIPRRGNAAKLAEEANIGRETIDWSAVKPEDYMKNINETLRHYGYFYEKKSYVSWAQEWVKTNRPNDLKTFKASEDWRVSATLASLMKMQMMGAELEQSTIDFINDNLEEVLSHGRKNIELKVEEKEEDDTVVEVKRKNPAELLKEKTNIIIGDIEGFIDDHLDGVLDTKFSLYTHLKGINAATQSARDIVTHYKEVEQELKELVEDKVDYLVEGYNHLSPSEQKKLYKLITSFVTDSEKYVLSKKATRKPRAKKATPATKQVEKVIYQKESADYKITSTSPAYIVGATEVYLFNTKTRVIKYLVTNNNDGFIVKGTSIKNYDEELSFKKKLRKPEETIDSINKVTKLRALKALKALKTADNPTDSRINADTVILKVNK
jgi:hypothetical protein